MRKMTGKEPNVTVNASEVVALGAIVQVCFVLLNFSPSFMEEKVNLSITDMYCKYLLNLH